MLKLRPAPGRWAPTTLSPWQEGAGSYGAGLAAFLAQHDEHVAEV